jgi:AraC-type transcriptional regulator N-terminus
MTQLHDLISRMDLQAEVGDGLEKVLPCGMGPAVMDEDMADATTRLIKCLQSDTESQILGPGLVRSPDHPS